MNVNEINAGVLAYVGDSVYEVLIRSHLLNLGLNNANKMQKLAINYVSAVNQAKVLNKLLDSNILNEEELYTISRARNYKPNSKPKYTDIKTYKKATALEALFGMLYINERYDRINELIKAIIGG